MKGGQKCVALAVCVSDLTAGVLVLTEQWFTSISLPATLNNCSFGTEVAGALKCCVTPATCEIETRVVLSPRCQ